MDPLVSVIIPVYNVRPYLGEALDSVLAQTYRNLEIVIIDDGSNDGSETICDEYQEKDSRITVIHQENLGLSAARNVGLDKMSGDIVAFLDSDDAFHPDMIRTLIDAMLRTHADVAVCGYSNYRTIKKMLPSRNHSDTDFSEEELLTSKEALIAMIEGRFKWSAWNKLYVAKLWSALRFPEGHVYEDVCTGYQIIRQSDSVLLVPGLLVFHRIRPGSITQTRSSQNAHDWVNALKQMEAFIKADTPSIFDQRHYLYIKEDVFQRMTTAYIRLPASEQRTAEDIRCEILERGKTTSLNSLSFRFRVAYSMLSFCPWVLPFARPIDQFFQSFHKAYQEMPFQIPNARISVPW